mmetsp:Transcript_8019/g.11452  ORF Transcript_8019/g.11452 Transcript_8019/m.11452 type:complete len:107 (-) Transcript_8019:1860-2180(-)
MKSDFLSTTLAVLKIQLGRVPLTLKFQSALGSIRNEVSNYNRYNGGKFRSARSQHRISKVKNGNRTKTRADSTWEMLTNGEVIEYHRSFRFGAKLQYFPLKLCKRL